MTKKFFSIILVLLTLSIFTTNLTSCTKDEPVEQKKDDKPDEPVDSLIIGQWAVKKVTLDGNDQTSAYLATNSKFELKFLTNGTFELERGTARLGGTYTFNKDRTQITLDLYDADFERYELKKINKKELHIKHLNGLRNYDFVFNKK